MAADALRDAGVEGFKRASYHADFVRGYRDPASGFMESWTKVGSAWERALDPGYDAVGLATVTDLDGWTVLYAIFVDDAWDAEDIEQLERAAFEAANAERLDRGLDPLILSERLSRVARAHSRDMLERDYFAHESPEGRRPGDRVAAAGIRFRQLAENLHSSSNFKDPVPVAVKAWIDSPGHRRNLLSPVYVESGMGVAVNGRGEVVFTQLFLLADGP